MAFLKRGSTYHFKRRVPKRFARVDPREFVRQSLHTDSRSVAEEKAKAIWGNLLSGWEAELSGEGKLAEERFRAAKNLAQLPLPELLDRIEGTTVRAEAPSGFRAEALLGGAKKPDINVSKALEKYWTLAADKTRGSGTHTLLPKGPLRCRAVVERVAGRPTHQPTDEQGISLRFRQRPLPNQRRKVTGATYDIAERKRRRESGVEGDNVTPRGLVTWSGREKT